MTINTRDLRNEGFVATRIPLGVDPADEDLVAYFAASEFESGNQVSWGFFSGENGPLECSSELKTKPQRIYINAVILCFCSGSFRYRFL